MASRRSKDTFSHCEAGWSSSHCSRLSLRDTDIEEVARVRLLALMCPDLQGESRMPRPLLVFVDSQLGDAGLSRLTGEPSVLAADISFSKCICWCAGCFAFSSFFCWWCWLAAVPLCACSACWFWFVLLVGDEEETKDDEDFESADEKE